MPRRLPNVVLILADDLGYGDVRSFHPASRIPTPHIDQLAREGVRFVDAHSNSAVCTPTRYGLLAPGSGGWSDPKPGSPEEKGLPPMQLYDLEADPKESKNVVAEHPEIVARLEGLLAGYRATGRSAPARGERATFRPGELWPDERGVHINAHGGGILDFEGRYYWFGEHKVEGEAGNSAQVGVHCYSSDDLYNWKDEGIVLPVVKDDPDHDIAVGSIVERPKVLHNRKTGKFVMWFHLERKGTGYASARTGVAVADRVTGPYAYRGSFRPNAGAWPRGIRPEQKVRMEAAAGHRYSGGDLPDEPDRLNLAARDFAGGQMARDQTLFVDDDGTAYHAYASEENSTLHISRLADDYLAPAGDYVRVFPGRFMEAPALFKHEGRYYLVASGCTGWAPNAARSAVADSIWGPWTELGNPAVGPDAERTFESQSTFVLPLRDRPGAFIFMADRWRPGNAIDGRYVWLPVLFRNGRFEIEWRDEWDLAAFEPRPAAPRLCQRPASFRRRIRARTLVSGIRPLRSGGTSSSRFAPRVRQAWRSSSRAPAGRGASPSAWNHALPIGSQTSPGR